MLKLFFCTQFAGLLLFCFPLLSSPVQFRPAAPGDDPADRTMVWRTDPGIRYELRESTDLTDWTTVAGFPTEAMALAMQHTLSLGEEPRFFQIVRLDEQPPALLARNPADNGFAVGRFQTLQMQLRDDTGVDPQSILLTLTGLGSFTLNDAQLTWEEDILTFDPGGDVALGGFGETIGVSLAVADVLGNEAEYAWSFDLELAPVAAANLLVLGSPQAQRMGQRLPSTPARFLAESSSGPTPMNDPLDPWELETVEEDRIVLAYSGDAAPEIAVGVLLTNLTPRTPEEIFYRRVVEVIDDPIAKHLTLLTEEADLEEFIEEGSLLLSEDTVMFEEDEWGEFTAARSLDSSVTLPTFGVSLEGISLYKDSDIDIKLGKLTWKFTPSLDAAIEIRAYRLRRLLTRANGVFEASLQPDVTATLSSSNSITRQLFRIERSFFFGSIGPVPIWGKVGFDLRWRAAYELAVSGTLSSGATQTMNLSFGANYERDREPALLWERSRILQPPQLLPITASMSGKASGSIRLIPELDITYLRLARFFANIDPGVEITGEGTVATGSLEPAEWTMRANADLNLRAQIIAFNLGEGSTLQYPLFSHVWSYSQPAPQTLGFTRQPEDVTATEGETVVLSATAVAAEPVTYQWFQDDLPLPGEEGEDLTLEEVGPGHTGPYRVEASAGDLTESSEVAVVEVELLKSEGEDQIILTDLVEVPGYPYQWAIGRHEVTWGEWKMVRAWAASNGYDIGNAGEGCADNHPVHSVNWFEVVKWCNAKSEMEGIEPLYVHEGEVFRTGEDFPFGQYNFQNFRGPGYRLPSSPEWLYAARAANTESYNYSGSSDGDEVGWAGLNAIGAQCATEVYWFGPGPGTWPVGLKKPNGLGLYDMSGNVREWTHSWTGVVPTFQTRGGGWGMQLEGLPRLGFDIWGADATVRRADLGFRLARRLSP